MEYGGKLYSLSNDERIVDKDDFAEELYEKIKNGEDYPEYIYGTEKRVVMNIDFEDIVTDACEDGYEEMSKFLDWEGTTEIQNLIDAWVAKQGNNNYIYPQTSNTVILLDELAEEIKKGIEAEVQGT